MLTAGAFLFYMLCLNDWMVIWLMCVLGKMDNILSLTELTEQHWSNSFNNISKIQGMSSIYFFLHIDWITIWLVYPYFVCLLAPNNFIEENKNKENLNMISKNGDTQNGCVPPFTI